LRAQTNLTATQRLSKSPLLMKQQQACPETEVLATLELFLPGLARVRLGLAQVFCFMVQIHCQALNTR
jgi:hypothetical protein